MPNTAAERDGTTRLKGELRTERQLIAKAQHQVARLQSDLESKTRAAEATETALVEMRHRLAETEGALARCGQEAEQSASDLAAAREELRRTNGARVEAEKVSAGLKEHIVLLMADVKEWHAAFAAAALQAIRDSSEEIRPDRPSELRPIGRRTGGRCIG